MMIVIVLTFESNFRVCSSHLMATQLSEGVDVLLLRQRQGQSSSAAVNRRVAYSIVTNTRRSVDSHRIYPPQCMTIKKKELY